MEKIQSKSADACYSASYMNQTLNFITSEVAADWHSGSGTTAHYVAIYRPRELTVGLAVLPADIPPLQSASLCRNPIYNYILVSYYLFPA